MVVSLIRGVTNCVQEVWTRSQILGWPNLNSVTREVRHRFNINARLVVLPWLHIARWAPQLVTQFGVI